MIFLFALGAFTVLALAWLPGNVAKERGHPSAGAIAALGWLSLLFPILWFGAIIWAYSVPAKPKKKVAHFDPRLAMVANVQTTSLDYKPNDSVKDIDAMIDAQKR